MVNKIHLLLMAARLSHTYFDDSVDRLMPIEMKRNEQLLNLLTIMNIHAHALHTYICIIMITIIILNYILNGRCRKNLV